MDNLKTELKKNLITQLNLEDKTPDDIADDAPLFGDNGLGLDSIDALELIVLLDKYYQIKLTNPEEGKTVFYSVNTLADYIRANKK
jgi:acyl carrier protein